MSVLWQTLKKLREPVPEVRECVERNLKISSKAQEIAQDLKQADPTLARDVLLESARLLAVDLGRRPTLADIKAAEVAGLVTFAGS